MRFHGPMTRAPVIAALLGLAVGGCAATTAGTAVSAPPPPAATTDTLAAHLLAGQEVGAAMAGAELVVAGEAAAPWDDSARLSDRTRGCLAVAGAGQRGAYTDSGFAAMRGQVLREPPSAPAWTRFATQAVALFPSAGLAGEFFARSQHDWVACANRELAYSQRPVPDQLWSTGPVAVDQGVLVVTRTQRSPQRWSCQRALTVHADVAVDVEACSLAGPTSAAAAIARRIADRLGPA